MNEHPIEGLMLTAMNSIEDMIDVNTIIGEPIETSTGTVIIPISKVCFGFAAGGSEFKGETVDEYKRKDKDESIQYRLPFGGGSGAGISIKPVSFLIVQEDKVKLLPVSHSSCIDKMLDYIPELTEKVQEILEGKKEEKESETMIIKEATKQPNKKGKINKVPKTTTEVLEKKKITKPEEQEAMQELEDMFEEEYEYEEDE